MTPLHPPTPLRRTRRPSTSRRIARLLALGASALLAMSGIGVAAGAIGATPAQAADPTGCSYGTNGPHAETICWLDFAGLNEAQVKSPEGQRYEIQLPGGYLASFDLSYTSPVAGDRPYTRTGAAGWGGSQFYRVYYRGVTGSPLLNSTSTLGTYRLNDISVTDPGDQAVTGYSLIAMDGEGSNGAERLIWRSDRTFYQVGVAPSPGLGCSPGVVFGGTTLDCVGGQGGTVIAGVADPSWIEVEAQGGDDVVFGIEFAKIELVKSFDRLVDPADSVDLTITSPSDTRIASVSTSGRTSTTTGGQTILPVGRFTLSEAPTAGSQTVLGNYTESWSCINRAAGSTTVLPSGSGATQTVSPAAGDDIVCTVTNTAKSRSLMIAKSLTGNDDRNADGLTDAGDRLSYAFEVRNTGELELHGIQVDDPKLGAVTCAATALAPGASTTCTSAPYTVTPADVAAGVVENTATVSALPPGSTNAAARITSTSNTVSTPTGTPAPALTLVKSSDHGSPAASRPGDTVTYAFDVENTGNVPVRGIAIAEGDFTGSGGLSSVACPAAEAALLAPGDTVRCTASYALTQGDVDAGAVGNTATATGTDPDGGGVASPPSTAGVEILAAPAFAFEKRTAAGGGSRAGETVAYEFEVTNTGNVSISEFGVTEGDFTGTGELSPIDCPPGPIPAGASAVCTAGYTLSQADVDAGGVTNTATASVTVPRGETPPPAPSTSSFAVQPAPALTIEKTSDTDRVTRSGQRVVYSFEIANTGNVTLSDVGVAEGAFTGTGAKPRPVCPAEAGSLAPGETVVCTAVYTVVSGDLTGGALRNTATAGATAPEGSPVGAERASTTSSATARTEDGAAVMGAGGGLAATGAETTWPAAVAALLLAGGVALILVRRRRV